MDLVSDLFAKIWFVMNWRILISCFLTFMLVTSFNKWIKSFDENGRLSPQERLKTTGFLIVSFIVITIIIYLLIDDIFGF